MLRLSICVEFLELSHERSKTLHHITMIRRVGTIVLKIPHLDSLDDDSSASEDMTEMMKASLRISFLPFPPCEHMTEESVMVDRSTNADSSEVRAAILKSTAQKAERAIGCGSSRPKMQRKLIAAEGVFGIGRLVHDRGS
jgi:hypothetical protein